jgi:hypothetical protein
MTAASELTSGELLLYGLTQHLPPPGSHWPESERRAWLAVAAGVLDLIYSESPKRAALTATSR